MNPNDEVSQPVSAEAVITLALAEQGPSAPGMAALILRALDRAGVVVLNPQDIEWGECPERTVEWDDNGGHEVSPPGPHSVSLDLCAFCLQYNPE